MSGKDVSQCMSLQLSSSIKWQTIKISHVLNQILLSRSKR